MIDKRTYLPLSIHLIGLLAICAGLLWAIEAKTGQLEYPYPLDDSYIHLAISRSLVEHGVLSPDPTRVDFSSSSPLFTILLAAAFFVTGPSVWWPMVLGVASGLILLVCLYKYLVTCKVSQHHGWLWLLLLLSPFPLLMLMGMEHMLQLLICFWWVRRWLHLATQDSLLDWQLLALTFLLVTIRYEGIFLAAGACLWWAMQRQWKPAILTGGVAAGTVTLIGGLSLTAGGTFLPLSLLMKGHHPGIDLSSFLYFVQQTLEKVYDHPFIFCLLTISAVAMWMGQSLPVRLRAFGVMLQSASWLHVLLAEIGGYRYEAYLVLLHLILLAELLNHKKMLLSLKLSLAGIWLALPLVIRVAFFTVNYPLSVQNIFHQSVQVGTFIQTYYPEAPLAIQDIGVATWLCDFPLTDLAGIGDGEINALFRDKTISPETIGPLLAERGVEVAIIQQGWMGWVIPEAWQAAGSWTIQDHFIVALPEVFFWAANEEAYHRLIVQLQEFSRQLPESVIEEGPYVGSSLPVVERAP